MFWWVFFHVKTGYFTAWSFEFTLVGSPQFPRAKSQLTGPDSYKSSTTDSNQELIRHTVFLCKITISST